MKTIHHQYSEQAAFYCTALQLGLLPGALVIKWGERIILKDNHAPQPLFELVTTPPDDITSIRFVLLEICNEAISEDVSKAVLALILRDLEFDKRDLNDSVTILSQFRRFNKIQKSIAEQIVFFEMRYDEAMVDGITDPIRKEIIDWLGQFRVSENKFSLV